eukprot:gene13014-biopygen4371
MLTLQSWTKIMKRQKPGGMRNARSTGELAGRPSKAAEGCCRQMKSRELLKIVKVRKPVQVPKAVGDREGKGGCARPTNVQGKPKTEDASDPK